MNHSRLAVDASVASPKLDLLLFCHNPAARAALVPWLARQHDLMLVGEAATAVDALELAIATAPDVVLVDVAELTDSVGAAVSVLKTFAPEPAVIVLTHDVSDRVRHRARAAGVDSIFDETGGLAVIERQFGRLRARLPGPVTIAR